MPNSIRIATLDDNDAAIFKSKFLDLSIADSHNDTIHTFEENAPAYIYNLAKLEAFGALFLNIPYISQISKNFITKIEEILN